MTSHETLDRLLALRESAVRGRLGGCQLGLGEPDERLAVAAQRVAGERTERLAELVVCARLKILPREGSRTLGLERRTEPRRLGAGALGGGQPADGQAGTEADEQPDNEQDNFHASMLTAGGDNFGDRRADRPANAAVPATPRPLRPDFAGGSGVTGRGSGG